MQYRDSAEPSDVELMHSVERIASAAGDRLLARFAESKRPADRLDMIAAIRANEAAASAGLREELGQKVPNARWMEREQETGPLPTGEWWVVDTVEGNVNHVHGLPEWGVSIALIRDGLPVVAVVRQPVGDLTFTAVRNGGAYVNGASMRTSVKQGLEVAIVGTGQAEAGQVNTYRRIGESVTVMLGNALLVRVQVPSTFSILAVATGHIDAFWQYEPNLGGVAAGVLLTTEAGGVVTTIAGNPWAPGADTILLAAVGVHEPARLALASVK